jgi:hypothetical protein
MRTSLRALLGVLGLLATSHVVAVTTESQVAAQFSWVLVSVLAVLVAVVAVESAYRWVRSVVASRERSR